MREPVYAGLTWLLELHHVLLCPPMKRLKNALLAALGLLVVITSLSWLRHGMTWSSGSGSSSLSSETFLFDGLGSSGLNEGLNGDTLNLSSKDEPHVEEVSDHSNVTDFWKHERKFREYGSAAAVFAEFGSYRSGSRQFAIVGLASKPLHVYGKPTFSCEWIPANHPARGPQQGNITKYRPDYNYGRVYTTVVLTCSFNDDVGTDGAGGQLIVNASRGDPWTNSTGDRIVAVTEKPGDFNASKFTPPYPYEFVYCGGPTHGNISARRVREWIAYHDMFFGEKCHFIFYDVGGIAEGIVEVLSPWIRLGRVSIHDVRSFVRFDGYHFNHFTLLNDCLYRSRFMANWTIYFDLDEFFYVNAAEVNSMESMLTTLKNEYEVKDEDLVQVQFEQYRMAPDFCHSVTDDPERRPISKQWGFEKLTYRDLTIISESKDVKSVSNPRKVYATGVHKSENVVPGGINIRQNSSLARYYHYHNTINCVDDDRDHTCQYESERAEQGVNFTRIAGNVMQDGSTGQGALMQYDGSMVPLCGEVRRHDAKILEYTSTTAS